MINALTSQKHIAKIISIFYFKMCMRNQALMVKKILCRLIPKIK